MEDKEFQDLQSDVDAVIYTYQSLRGEYDGGFGGACVVAAQAVFEEVLTDSVLVNPDRLEIFAVWNAFLFNTFQRPIGHVCLRYFVGEDRSDPEDYVYIDADLQFKEYEDIEAWGHVPQDLAVEFPRIDPEDPSFDNFGDEEEFEVITENFLSVDDFKSSSSYRLYCSAV